MKYFGLQQPSLQIQSHSKSRFYNGQFDKHTHFCHLTFLLLITIKLQFKLRLTNSFQRLRIPGGSKHFTWKSCLQLHADHLMVQQSLGLENFHYTTFFYRYRKKKYIARVQTALTILSIMFGRGHGLEVSRSGLCLPIPK